MSSRKPPTVNMTDAQYSDHVGLIFGLTCLKYVETKITSTESLQASVLQLMGLLSLESRHPDADWPKQTHLQQSLADDK